MENIIEFRNIILGHKIEVFIDRDNLTYETIESASRYVLRWKSPIQEFWVNLIHNKRGDNSVADAFRWPPMVYHAHKISDTTLE